MSRRTVLFRKKIGTTQTLSDKSIYKTQAGGNVENMKAARIRILAAGMK